MFGDFKSVREIEQEMCAGYDVEYYDRASLKEMERMIHSDSYADLGTVRDHMAFLEHLLFKLQSIRIEEIKEGFQTLELDESISEINMLFRKLTTVLYLLKSKASA